MGKKLFNNTAEPVITPEAFYGEKRDCADVCMVIFSSEVYAYLVNSFECKQAGVMYACCGDTPIHVFEHEGRRIAFYQSYIGAAMARHQVIESNWLTGAEKYIMFGSAGSLNDKLTHGRYVVPTRAFRGEGMSQYYAENGEYIDIKGAMRVADCFHKLGVPFIEGPVWTTDAIYRETKELCDAFREEGALAVEMELAGVQAVCDFYGLELYDFLETGDVLDGAEYDVATLSEANHGLQKLKIALNLALYV